MNMLLSMILIISAISESSVQSETPHHYNFHHSKVDLGPVLMEASQPAYRAGPVGETVFILCSHGKFPARLPRQKLDTCQN